MYNSYYNSLTLLIRNVNNSLLTVDNIVVVQQSLQRF
jgi:hypothetical protein